MLSLLLFWYPKASAPHDFLQHDVIFLVFVFFLLTIMESFDDWSSFDVFVLAETNHGGRPLQTVVRHVLEVNGLMDMVDRSRLESFLEDIENMYLKENPYHTSTHAADVVHSIATMIQVDSWSKGLQDWEVLSLIIAAACHDVGHQGVTNEYHGRVQTEWSQTYGQYGSSVNEQAHAMITVSLMEKESNDFLHAFDPGVKQRIIEYVEKMILQTDITGHVDVCEKFSQACSRGLACGGMDMWSPEDRMQALSGLLHFADISNPGRPWHLCKRWSIRIHDEMVLQGNMEEERGFVRSPYMASGEGTMALNQVAFIQKTLKPFCDQISVIAPTFTSMIRPHISKALEKWEECRAVATR